MRPDTGWLQTSPTGSISRLQQRKNVENQYFENVFTYSAAIRNHSAFPVTMDEWLKAVKTEYEAVVTTNCEKSAEAIVPDWTYTVWEGLNLRR
jgi:hypothetical protein